MSEEATLDEFTDDSEELTEPQPSKSRFWGDVPEGWELVEGSEVYDVNPNPKPDETPNTYIEMDALDTELPWPKYFGERDATDYSGKTFTTGDTLFARITPCTENGKAALVPEMNTRVGIGSTEYAVLSPHRDQLNPWYLYYLSKSHPVHDYAVSRMRGSTGRQRVPFSVFRRELDISLPPLEEQRKNATVLYTVDQTIEKTEEIIEQIKSVRRGLKQDLLTGEGENKDRKSVNLEPVEAKIPEDWEVVTLGDVTENITEMPHHMPDKIDDGVPFITTGDISEDEKIDLNSVEQISEEDYQDLSERFDAEKGDILYTRYGTIGIAKDVDFNPKFIASYSVALLKPNERIDSTFLTFQLNSWLAKKQAASRTTQSANKNFDLERIPKLNLVLPDEETQLKIARIMSDVNSNLMKEKEFREQLRILKKSLIRDLLSGTVRTTDTNIEVPDEIVQHG